MLLLGKSHIEKCVDYLEVLGAVEDAFRIYHKKEFKMPLRFSYEYQNKTLLYMPCFIENFFGTKSLVVLPENKKLMPPFPVIDGLMLLNDFSTGKSLCLLDAKTLTSLRTGAAGGGLGAKYFSGPNADTVCLIGCGVQGLYQLVFCCSVREIKNIFIYDQYIADYSAFIQKLKSKIKADIKIKACSSSEEAAEKAEIIITATTSAEPVFPNDKKLFEGKCLVGIGSYKPQMREYPEALMTLKPQVVIDCDHAIEESGDIIAPVKNGSLKTGDITEMAEIVAGKVSPREGTVFYKSVGMGLFDIVAGKLIYEKARKLKQGFEFDFDS